MKWNWKYLLIILGIGWFLGAASGMLMMRFGHSLGFHAWHSHRMRESFYEKLNLTPEQKTQVDAILQASRQKLDQIHDGEQAQVDEVRNGTRGQIRQLLTAEQQVIFDQLNAQKDVRLKKHMGHKTNRMHE